ncbi:hypothetical protein HDU99_007205, partial [Rhizoclosmatium hyalinum]
TRAKSCSECRYAKKMCDRSSTQPNCSRCVRTGKACTFSVPTNGKHPRVPLVRPGTRGVAAARITSMPSTNMFSFFPPAVDEFTGFSDNDFADITAIFSTCPLIAPGHKITNQQHMSARVAPPKAVSN